MSNVSDMSNKEFAKFVFSCREVRDEQEIEEIKENVQNKSREVSEVSNVVECIYSGKSYGTYLRFRARLNSVLTSNKHSLDVWA